MTKKYKCESCNNNLEFTDEMYHCKACGAIYEPQTTNDIPNIKQDYKVLFFTLVEHSINKLFGFYLMVIFLLSMMVYSFEYASNTHLAWWYVVIQIIINVAFFYSAYKLGEEKINEKM